MGILRLNFIRNSTTFENGAIKSAPASESAKEHLHSTTIKHGASKWHSANLCFD